MINPFDRIAKEEIDGYTFHIYKLRTSPLLKYGTQLAKVVLPILAEQAEQQKLDMIDMTRLADLLVENIDNVQLEELVPVLLKDATVDGSPLDYENFFSGKFMTLIKLIKFALEQNFLNFFEGSMPMSGFIPE